ncbi:MAG TPA: ribosome-associated translation inhibitor RaiA [Vicinamibacterales bacterium]|nr:ribosome-associated translation inhibitor RaiA [Vicinamibacterales bacterium]
MKLTVTGRHVAVTEAIRTDITKKMGRLHRVLNNSAVSGQCVVSRERQTFICELTVHVSGDHMLHAVGRDTRLTVAVAQAIEKVGQQGRKVADRWKTRKRNNGSSPRRVTAAEAEQGGTPRVVRSRDYAIKPMNVEDAVLELSAGGRPFLVFRQAASERIAVLFRRPDGHFGLIEPEA